VESQRKYDFVEDEEDKAKLIGGLKIREKSYRLPEKTKARLRKKAREM
jgi:hypothetical protein